MALKKKFGATSDPHPDAPPPIDGYYRVRQLTTSYEKNHGEEPGIAVFFEVEILELDTMENLMNKVKWVEAEPQTALGTRMTEEGEILQDVEVEMGVGAYNQEYSTEGLAQEGATGYSIELPADTPYNQFLEKAYEHLKTLDLFKDAEDC
jgi:hypothetical protein